MKESKQKGFLACIIVLFVSHMNVSVLRVQRK